MEELKALLENYFIVKEQDKELYFAIKDNLKNFKSFLSDKLGYNLIIRNEFIKLEKLPGNSEEWMGIEAFQDKNEYIFFVLILMFLEDKAREEQFLLSHLVDYLSANSVTGTLEWTQYRLRRQLVTVIKFCIRLCLFVVNEEEEHDFALDERSEALYENTGLSKYVVRNFPFELMKCRDYRDMEGHSGELLDTERGFIRRNRVYRKLLLEPAVYSEGAADEDYLYIKNFRPRIDEDFHTYLNWTLHVHRNGALVIPSENESLKNSFPSTAGISDVVLHINNQLHEMVKASELKRGSDDVIDMDEEAFSKILAEVKDITGEGWSKEYREMSDQRLLAEVIDYMKEYKMLSVRDKLYIYPLIGKIVGQYPEDFRMEGKAFLEAAIGGIGDEGGQ